MCLVVLKAFWKVERAEYVKDGLLSYLRHPLAGYRDVLGFDNFA